jgi:uncharacterized protein YbjQ (UPF0145 family)
MADKKTVPEQPTTESPYRVGAEVNRQILVTTSNDIEGHRISRYLGIVRGIVVRAPSLGKGLIGSFKALGGGTVKEFVDVCENVRHEAYEQMLGHAVALGADAIIAMRYDATEFMQGASEVLAYGTAVQLERRG